MSRRFYVHPPIDGDRVLLDGTEAHHLLHVLRAVPGEQIVLFDGSGAEFDACVDHVGRSQVTCQVLARNAVDRELSFKLTLAVALPKGERQRWLVEKAVELGVGRLVPLVTQRSTVKPAESALVRLRRAVIEASKQCGRNLLMEIPEPYAWDHLIGKSTKSCPRDQLVRVGNARRLVAHPGAEEGTLEFSGLRVGSPAPRQQESKVPPDTILAIGPEGGFTGGEISMARDAGWSVVDLGPRILRVETAAMSLVAAVVMQSY